MTSFIQVNGTAGRDESEGDARFSRSTFGINNASLALSRQVRGLFAIRK